ncbi:MAG: glycosyltransferase family 2 protein [Clostridia bacterium]|nr:glycosyltransferase family 2 protein [Clostridia bacterium]
MKFSILVPVYNVEAYVEECIQSVLNQSCRDFELVLVDDGSTDDSGIICDRYAQQKPEQIRVIHKENQGLISARRVGIAEARGEFCVFLDSDDFAEENLLEVIAGYLEKDPQTDVLLYSFRYCRDGRKAERYPVFKEDGYVWDDSGKKELYEALILTNGITSIWTKAVRTSVLRSDPTDYSVYYGKNMAEDLLQSLYPLTAAGRIMYTDKILYNYRINSESISRAFRYETIPNKNTVHVYHKIREYLPVWGMDTPEIRERLNARWFHDMMYMFSRYYEAAGTKEQREQILSYPWDSMLPEEARRIENPCLNEAYRKLYLLWKKGNKAGIHRYFRRKKWYLTIRNWKRALLS